MDEIIDAVDTDPELSSLFDPETAGLLVIDIQEKLWPFIHDKEEGDHGWPPSLVLPQ